MCAIMRPRWATTAFLATACLVALADGAFAQPITRLVSFGDSLTDTGNVFGATGSPGPPYYQGRFSNGPLWVERLAARLGVTAPTPSLTGGTNNAVGGAETGTGNSPQGSPNIRTQVSTWLAGQSPAASDLITVWGGGWDFVNGQTNPAIPAANLAAAVTTLANAGGRRFLVPNLPQLGDLPYAQSFPPDQRTALNAMTVTFNGQLNTALNQVQASNPGIQVFQLDVDGLFQQIRANPGQYGFTNVTSGALGDGVTSGLGYLFWDNFHPSAAGHQLIGDAAFAVVPEPSALALAGLAAALALARTRRFGLTTVRSTSWAKAETSGALRPTHGGVIDRATEP
ncbi:MAG: SGNH/GDSL hydrolase family protein [Gemmataceae bacterium]